MSRDEEEVSPIERSMYHAREASRLHGLLIARRDGAGAAVFEREVELAKAWAAVAQAVKP